MFSHSERGSPSIYKASFSLAMANSGMNPMIYAWKNTGLRAAFVRLLRGKHPDAAWCNDDWMPTKKAAAAAAGKKRGRSLWRPTSRCGRAVRLKQNSITSADESQSDAFAKAMAADVERKYLAVLPEMSKRLAKLLGETIQVDKGQQRMLDVLHIDVVTANALGIRVAKLSMGQQRFRKTK